MFLPERKMLAEYQPHTRIFQVMHVSSDPKSEQCTATISLDGKRYRCARRYHYCQGAHDADVKHTDGGLVRW